MSRQWDAEVALTQRRAAELIEDQFPELAPVRLELLGRGWDNDAYLTGGTHVFRFPRREFGRRALEAEQYALPRIAPHLPLPAPRHSHAGRPTEDYPFPFAGHPLLPGELACSAGLDDRGRAAHAAPLGRFLAALHGLPIDDATRAAAPGDWIDRADLPRRAARLLQLLPRLADVDHDRLARTIETLAGAPRWPGPSCWVHGDLYPRHLLVDPQGALCGVIDWGDAHLGDPALDLSIAWTHLPEAAHAEFLAAYGPVDEATWCRARFRALHYGVFLLDYGTATGDAALVGVARRALAV